MDYHPIENLIARYQALENRIDRLQVHMVHVSCERILIVIQSFLF